MAGCAASTSMSGRIPRPAGAGKPGPGALDAPRALLEPRPVTGSRSARPLALAGALLAAGLLALALAPRASAQLTATGLRVASNPKAVRVIVDFAGARLTGLARQVDAVDPQIADGRGVVRINATGITSGAAPASGAGVAARIVRRPGSVLVRIRGAPGRFKFL